jgi:septal ring factor EnvC (AmiA/AmiB activator)
VLDNTRTAYGKLRNEVAELEKKANLSEKECQALRQELTTTQSLLRTLEATKAEIAIDIAARRAQIVDLEARLAQETGEGKALREENRRLDERLSTTDKRAMAVESELNGARQRLLILEDEKRAQQISLDKISAEAARLSRKLAETEANLTATQGRLRHVDGNVAELNTERTRLTGALMRRTNGTDMSSQPSACASTLCRHAPPRVKSCSARHASTCWRAQTRSEPMIAAPANLRLNVMPCRHASPNSRLSASSVNPSSRKSIRPARPSSNAAPRSPAHSRQRKRR